MSWGWPGKDAFQLGVVLLRLSANAGHGNGLVLGTVRPTLASVRFVPDDEV